jgi:hypothetical protein
MPDTPQFDTAAASKAGYSDDEILQHLTQSRGFDIQGALKSGYSKQEIIQHLSGAAPKIPQPSEQQGPTQPGQQFSAGLIPQGATISAAPQPQGIAAKAEKWAGDVQSDIKQGTDTTMIGSLLKKMGAKGTSQGVPESVGNYMASPILGPAQMVQGSAQQYQGKLLRGAGNVVGGAMNTAQIPSSFMGPEAAGAAAEAIPNANRAGTAINTIVAGAKDLKVPVFDATAEAARAKEMFHAGAPSLPPPMRRFLTRVMNPDNPPLTLEEARDFYQASTKQTAKVWSEMSGPMKRQMAQFTQALGKNIEQALNIARPGEGTALRTAMDEYHNAMQIKNAGVKALKLGGAALGTTALGAAGYAGWKAMKNILP